MWCVAAKSYCITPFNEYKEITDSYEMTRLQTTSFRLVHKEYGYIISIRFMILSTDVVRVHMELDSYKTNSVLLIHIKSNKNVTSDIGG